jgi:uncharacterized membrane protein
MSNESPYEPPKSSLVNTNPDNMRRMGRYVVLDPDLEWPSRCFKCNKETNHKKEVKLVYVNPWIYLTILINFLITLILAMVVQKKFTVYLPLCEEHRIKRRNFIIFQWSMVALFVAALSIGIVTESLVFAAIAILVFLIILISGIFGRLAFAAKFKNGNVWIRGAGKDFLDSLPELVD